MTNANMVKNPAMVGRKLPEPNLGRPSPVPAPEDDPRLFTTEDPLDSPGPKPMIDPPRTKGSHKA